MKFLSCSKIQEHIYDLQPTKASMHTKCIKKIGVLHTALLKSYVLYGLINCLPFIKSARMIYTANRTHHPPKHTLNLTYIQTKTY